MVLVSACLSRFYTTDIWYRFRIYCILEDMFFPLIRDSCDYVCPYTKPCDGYNFLDFIEKLCQFEQNAVFERKCYFRDFYIFNFRFKRDEVHGMEKVCGCLFRFLLSEMKLLILASILAFILCCDTRHQMVSHWRFCFLKSHLLKFYRRGLLVVKLPLLAVVVL